MRRTLALISIVFFLLGVASQSQQTASPLPRIIRISGTMLAAKDAPRSATVGMTFSLYSDQNGGAPLWQETQNVAIDANGRYSVLLGAASKDGIPAELFMSNEARWLGVQGEQEAEQSRVLLVSVPYALKAGDAETVGGHPMSDFVLSTATPGSSTTSAGAGTSSNGATKPKSSATPSAPLAATTVNAVAKFSDTAGTVANSQMIDNGTGVGIGGAGTTARLTVGAGAASTASEEALHVDGSVPVIRLLAKGNLRWGWLGEFPVAGQSTFWNYATGKPLITLNSAGTVGVGTLNPSARLTVGDGTAAEEALHINGQVPIIRLLSQGTLRWGWLGEFPTPGQSTFWNYTNGQPLITMNSAGLVGIGTTSPSNTLSVAGVIESTTGGYKFPDGSVQSTGAGAGTAARTRGITFLAGCDTCNVLADTDDQKAIYVNVIGAMTIQSVTCYSDAGTPIINIQRNTGAAAANILSPDLTCSTAGTNSVSLVAGQSALNLGDILDFSMVTAGGAAHRVTVVIKTQLN